MDSEASSTTDAPTLDVGLASAKALFFLAAGLSFLLSVYFYFSGDPQRGIFVGIWVPSILSAGNLLIGGTRHD
jgi:Trk-type K+ transport system membrane component